MPDYTGCFATRPEVATAWITLASTVRTGMDRRRFELATIAAARTRGSTYCTAAHVQVLRDACRDEPTLRALAQDPDGGHLPPVDAAVYRFAAMVAAAPTSVDHPHVDALRALGLRDSDIADIVYAVGLRLFFATVIDALGAEPDAELMATFDDELLTFVRGPRDRPRRGG